MPVSMILQVCLGLAISSVLIGLGMFSRTRPIAVILSTSLLILSLPLIPFPWLRCIGIILCPALLLSHLSQASSRTTLLMCGLPMFIVLGWITQHKVAEVAIIDRLRTRFPVESLAPRLALEVKGTPLDDPILLSALVASELQQENAEMLYRLGQEGGRTTRLKVLHDESYREFVASSGFGFSRTWPESMRPLDLPEPQSVPQPIRPSLPDSYLADRYSMSQKMIDISAFIYPETQSEGRIIHRSASGLFLDPRQWGAVTDLDHVVGFQAHHVAEIPHTGQLYSGETRRWGISQLQLVSLLKHDTPRVYVSENLPDMKELATEQTEVPTRELTPFESHALPALKRESNLIINEAPSHILMLGALRASESCRECHRVEYGALLGAFSYVLAPAETNGQ